MKLGTLVTVANPREAVRNSRAAHDVHIPVVVDSGAWSNHTGAASVSVEAHIRHLRDYWLEGARHLALDVIKDPVRTFQNWMLEREAGLAVEPTIHYGTDVKFIDRYLRAGLATEWVNLGGMAHLQSKPAEHRRLASWCAAVMRRCPDGTRFHGLGATAPGLNQLIRFHAVDSTYWMQIVKWGIIPVFDPSIPKFVNVPRQLKNREWMKENFQKLGGSGELLRRSFGVNASDVLHMSEPELIRLAVLAHCEFAHHYEKRHGHEMTVYLAGSGIKQYDLIGNLNRNEDTPCAH